LRLICYFHINYCKFHSSRENCEATVSIEMIFQLFQLGTRGIFIFGGGNKRLRNITKMYCQCQISHKRRKKECLQSIPFKNAVDVATDDTDHGLLNLNCAALITAVTN
jgi:hypothetical protein